MKKVIILIQAAAVVVLLLSGNFCAVRAQNNAITKDYVFNNQVRFSFSTMLYDNLKIENQGERHFKSHPTFSGETTISYYNHIYNGYGISLGLGLGLAPYNLNYNIKAPENSVFRTSIYKDSYEYLDLNYSEYLSIMYVFPVSLTKTFTLKKHLFSVGIGAKCHIPMDKTYEIEGGSSYYVDENNTDVRLFQFYLEDTGEKPLVSYFVKLGIIKITKKHNSCHLNLVANYSPNKIGKGWYKFHNLGYESNGSVKHNINYIGFEFIYGLTFSKRKNSKRDE